MSSAGLSQAYQAARTGAGLIVRDHGLIVVSGRDRASYLQGLLTNDVVSLAAGQGCYSAYLTAQGRMIADLHVYELGDVMLLVVPRATKDTVLAKLDQFIFSEDVQLGDVTDAFMSAALVGPDGPRVAATAIGVDAVEVEGLALHGVIRRDVNGQPVIVRRIDDAGVAGVELIGPRQVVASLADAARSAGAADVDSDTANVLRVEGGVPLFGPDMDEETIPLEAGIESRGISFNKGCYVGQEIIIRVLHRGHGRVARKLVGLVFGDGAAVPAPGTTLQASDKEIGAVTSSAFSPALGRAVALGYVKRDFAEPGTAITAASASAEVVPLPFVPPS